MSSVHWGLLLGRIISSRAASHSTSQVRHRSHTSEGSRACRGPGTPYPAPLQVPREGTKPRWASLGLGAAWGKALTLGAPTGTFCP